MVNHVFLTTILVNHIFLLVPSIKQANPGNVIFQPFMVFRRTNVTLHGGRVVIPEVHHVPKSKVSTPTFSIWIPILKSILSLRCTPPKKKLTWNLKIYLRKKKGETSTQPHVFWVLTCWFPG